MSDLPPFGPDDRRGCGTDPGYYAHRRLGEQPCWRCCAAHAKAENARYAALPPGEAARRKRAQRARRNREGATA